jgi:hypothetical protein
VPFAMRAESATAASTITNNALPGDLFVGGNVGIGTDAPGEKLSVSGTIQSTSGGFKYPDGTSQVSAGYSTIQVDNLIASLASRIADLESKLQGMSRAGGDIYFTGVNVHIVNGQSGTETKNGFGNLIIGYNEPRETGSNRNGSHNLVARSRHNYSSYGGIVAGQDNEISGPYASVTGGGYNKANGSKASVTGGFSNVASGAASCISGGYGNTTTKNFSSISGGESNTANGSLSSISGGSGNNTTGYGASISGGRNNKAIGEYASVNGGGGPDPLDGNLAVGNYTSILGGSINLAGDGTEYEVEPNGRVAWNVGSDTSVGMNATINGGIQNHAIGGSACVTGGQANTASGLAASVSGGSGNNATEVTSSVTGGILNSV